MLRSLAAANCQWYKILFLFTSVRDVDLWCVFSGDRYLVHLEVQGDPAWECLVNTQKWLLKLMHRCQSEHVDKGQIFGSMFLLHYFCSFFMVTFRRMEVISAS